MMRPPFFYFASFKEGWSSGADFVIDGSVEKREAFVMKFSDVRRLNARRSSSRRRTSEILVFVTG